MSFFSKVLAVCTVVFLQACETLPSSPASVGATEHYESCAAALNDLLEVISCGKTARNNYCQPNNTCSNEGNMHVAWFDMLAENLRMNAITPVQAKFLFRQRLQDIEISRLAIAREAEAARKKASADFNASLIKWGKQIQEQSGGGGYGGYGSSSQVQGIYSHYEVSGTSKICFYSVHGNKRAVNIKVHQNCPANWTFTN